VSSLAPQRSPVLPARAGDPGPARVGLGLAAEAGVRYFDAARSYGRAEGFLGEWLEGRLRDDVVVGSEWGYVYTADWKVLADCATCAPAAWRSA
jgi:aryl-alcohol dehydrogenase-like predicted oxidoreductase